MRPSSGRGSIFCALQSNTLRWSLLQRQDEFFREVGLIVDWVFAQSRAAKIIAITDERNTGAQALLIRLGWPFVTTLGPDVEIVGRTEHVFEYARPNDP